MRLLTEIWNIFLGLGSHHSCIYFTWIFKREFFVNKYLLHVLEFGIEMEINLVR